MPVKIGRMIWLPVLLPLSLLCYMPHHHHSLVHRAFRDSLLPVHIWHQPALLRCWVWGKEEPLIDCKWVTGKLEMFLHYGETVWSVWYVVVESGPFRLHECNKLVCSHPEESWKMNGTTASLRPRIPSGMPCVLWKFERVPRQMVAGTVSELEDLIWELKEFR